MLWTDPNIGLGNLMYMWLQAAVRRGRGQDTTVLRTQKTLDWAPWFPDIVADLTIARSDVSFFNPRIIDPMMFQRFGDDFTIDELEKFIDETILVSGSPFGDLVERTPPVADLAINIRRGDYYSQSQFRGRYSFDIVEYVRAALASATKIAPFSRVLIISDDLEWCRIKLTRLLDGIEVVYPEPGTDPAHQLAMLAVSPRLILTNSTFSYWAGYLSNRVHVGMNHANVIAPWFHSRDWSNGAADQLDPRWSIVTTIPGGWDG